MTLNKSKKLGKKPYAKQKQNSSKFDIDNAFKYINDQNLEKKILKRHRNRQWVKKNWMGMNANADN